MTDSKSPRPPISVCMATYNGERYLQPQIDSILQQLQPQDELVVVDDGSLDDTVLLLQALRDPRIRVHPNARNLGHVGSFARALSLARHPVIAMADQDDVWPASRLDDMVAALQASGACLASGNSTYVDGEGRPVPELCGPLLAQDSRRHWRNILGVFAARRGYFGCAMVLRRELLEVVLPIPQFVESHDLWIALAANLHRSNVHVERSVLLRRVHGSNASVLRRPLWQQLVSRWVFLRSLAVLTARRLPPVPPL
jgi:glycosyltransferase involved in cell wall biosynthesis